MLVHQSSSIYVVGCASSTKVGKWLQGPDEITGTKTETLLLQLELPRARTRKELFLHWSSQVYWIPNPSVDRRGSSETRNTCCLKWVVCELVAVIRWLAVYKPTVIYRMSGNLGKIDLEMREPYSKLYGVWASTVVRSADILTCNSGSQFGFKWSIILLSIQHTLVLLYFKP